MGWNKYTIHTLANAEEPVTALLSDCGITGIEIEDNLPVSPEESGGLFGDVVPELDTSDPTARISFYVDTETPEEESRHLLKQVREHLAALGEVLDIGSGEITSDLTREEDWINNWKEHFHAFHIDDLQIIPSWEEEAADPRASMILHIDPGTAFGTGKHETTSLAIRRIRELIRPGMRLLDIGTGSGILGIVAVKSGAEYVFGTDLDPAVVPAIEDNLKKNNVDPRVFRYELGDIASDRELQERAGGPFDIVVANIIAEILEGITPAVPQLLKKGGYYITSGILTSHAYVVKNAIAKAGLTFVSETVDGEWESIVAVRE